MVDCSDTYDNFCAVAATLTGLAVGAAAAILLDGVLAIDTARRRRDQPRPIGDADVSVAGGNTVFGVVGRF